MFRRYATFFLALCCCLTAAANPGKNPKGGESLFEDWEDSKIRSIELHVDLDSLQAQRFSEEYLPATVKTGGEELHLQVAVRGRFRRRNCAMPPLRLKFAKQDLRDRGLNTHNDFKLVTHCSHDEAGRDAILREQLAYELYRTINPSASFRTRLLNVTYVNTTDGTRTESVAILIEDYDELQERLGLDACKDCYGSTAGQISNLEEVTLFQYMIGNRDFDVLMLRNLKVLLSPTGTRTLVPYDFDFSGLVNSAYAQEKMGATDGATLPRRLVITCEGSTDFTDAARFFLSQRTVLLSQVELFAGLSPKSKREITRYLNGFFRELRRGSITAIN